MCSVTGTAVVSNTKDTFYANVVACIMWCAQTWGAGPSRCPVGCTVVEWQLRCQRANKFTSQDVYLTEMSTSQCHIKLTRRPVHYKVRTLASICHICSERLHHCSLCVLEGPVFIRFRTGDWFCSHQYCYRLVWQVAYRAPPRAESECPRRDREEALSSGT